MSEVSLPPIINDLVTSIRDQRNSRVHRENLYYRLLDMIKVLSKAVAEYEKEQNFRRK